MFRRFLLVLLCVIVRAQNEGERCDKNGVQGICRRAADCQSLERDIQSVNLKYCKFEGIDAIFCCTEDDIASAPSSPAPPSTHLPTSIPKTRLTMPTTTESIKPEINHTIDNTGSKMPKTDQTLNSQCTDNGVAGVCKSILDCPSAITFLKNGRQPQICERGVFAAIVCCTYDITIPAPIEPTTPATTTTTSIVAPTPTTIQSTSWTQTTAESFADCPAVDSELTAPKTGQKAWDKCLEYQDSLIFPCEQSAAPTVEVTMVRKNKCYRNTEVLVVGGEDAKRNEFPHMALLGFGVEPQWLCGGSLISDKFILTAAHCTITSLGNVTYAYIGALHRNETSNPDGLYKIARIINHPDYRSPQVYNDIALLELDRSVKLDENTVPACLHVGDSVEDDRVLATGWGLTQFAGQDAQTLQKVELGKFTYSECESYFKGIRLMSRGLDNTTQICYGDKQSDRDTCKGDSGGPVQIMHKRIKCMHLIVGLTSTSIGCGQAGLPAVYTRITPYISWMESLVWP